MTVSEADRLKAVEEVRRAIAPIFGGTPSWKRRRGIYRALKRKDPMIYNRYLWELGCIKMMNEIVKELYK